MIAPVQLLASLLAGVLLTSMALRAADLTAPGQTGPIPETAAIPERPETALFVRVCVDCHDAERTTSRRRTRAEWAETIRQMIDDGAEATDEEFATILDYLVTEFGALAVNSAAPADLVKVLGVSARDADAIVAYRTTQGPFRDLAALKQVPGIDIAKLEEKERSLRF